MSSEHGQPPDRLPPLPDEDEEFLTPLTDADLQAFGGPTLRWTPVEAEPSALVARYLFPTEKFRGEWRPHVVRLVRAALFIAGYTALSIAIVRRSAAADQIRPLTIWIVTLAVAATAGRALGWYYTRFVLTHKRLLLVRGLFYRRVATLPLSRVVDVSYAQLPLGRVFNYATFVVESASRWSGLHRIPELPAPNELYLRLVEEMYEPEAVEARLSRFSEDLLGEVPETVSAAVRHALSGPPLVDYQGWVSVAVRDEDGQPVPIGEDRTILLAPGLGYALRVTIGRVAVDDLAEPLTVTGGVPADEVPFLVEVDSDLPALRRPPVPVTVIGNRPSTVELTIDPTGVAVDSAPWLWVRISQGRRTLQSIELTLRLDRPTPPFRPAPRGPER